MEYKQAHIAEELKRRIADGVYTDRLPNTLTLAEEFGVNIKTANKALARLVEAGLLERKKRAGTRIVQNRRGLYPERMIEVIFEGFTTIFTHPFYYCHFLHLWSPIGGHADVCTPCTWHGQFLR